MPSPQTSRASKTARKLAKEVIQAAREPDIEESFEEIDAEDQLSENHELSIEGQRDSYDVFFDCGKKAQSKGVLAEFIIKKNGERMSTKLHPYSWDQCHKEFGAGLYDILARVRGVGTILGRQSQMLGSLDEGAQIEESVPTNGSYSQPDPFAIFKLMKDNENEAKREAREIAAQQSNAQAELLKTVLLVSGQTKAAETGGSTQMFQMMMEMNRSNMEAMKQMNENNNRLFEKLSDRINQIATSKPKDEFGPMAIMKMMQDAETRGMGFIEKMNEKIEKKAEERAELLSAASGDEETEKGMWGTLKGFIPLLTQAVQKMPAPGVPALQPGQVSAQEVAQMRHQESEFYRRGQLQEQERQRAARKAQLAAERSIGWSNSSHNLPQNVARAVQFGAKDLMW